MKILLIDSNNLAHRMAFKLGHLTWQEKTTGVIFGFMKSVMDLSHLLKPNEIIFCWDSPLSYRRNIFPEYKASRRKELTEEQQQERKAAYSQFEELKLEILPRIGFRNIFEQTGIEADDLIAKIIFDYYLSGYKLIPVSSDNDLFQTFLYMERIYLLDKKKFYTKEDFVKEWKISPLEWVTAKSIAGDITDNIPGIKGIGIKTAIKYINGEKINASLISKVEENWNLVQRNQKIIKIPHTRTLSMSIEESIINLKEFESVCLENGFSFLLRKENFHKWLNLLEDLPVN